jgi:hypothetical protein
MFLSAPVLGFKKLDPYEITTIGRRNLTECHNTGALQSNTKQENFIRNLARPGARETRYIQTNQLTNTLYTRCNEMTTVIVR